MIVSFVRVLIGIALVPACWGAVRTAMDCLCVSTRSDLVFSAETIAFLGGFLVFVLCWVTLGHPVRTYVLGHELTHALWGLFFGARPSKVRVTKTGGSVRLTKTNFLITLAPYFFPFYTVVVILLAVLVSLFVRPLPLLPAWTFAIGFTWSFHVLFTLGTLSEHQPDIARYGRLFSWPFIFLVNVAIVLAALAATTLVSFPEMWRILSARVASAYVGVASAVWSGVLQLVDFAEAA